MKILQILTRVYTSGMDETLPFYENLAGATATSRFGMPSAGLELAVVRDILIIAGTDEAILPFRTTSATYLVDSLDEYHRFLVAHGATILRPPQQVPTGWNMTVRHPDGAVIEYVEHRNNS
jgi:predicted enzyme related to lactoylglutathione lyase